MPVLVECGFVDGESVGVIEGTGVEGWEDAAREGGVATRDKEVSKVKIIGTSSSFRGNPSETPRNGRRYSYESLKLTRFVYPRSSSHKPVYQ